ncbi:hypothetical protein AYO38_08945 [bacterium SCGC AG-212-C10]|nr:hypothetical protein AYO38_08945 [bacterium SCGC AG-212-C10]
MGRIVLTLDRHDFIQLHQSSSHVGILVCTGKLSAPTLAARIHAIVSVQDLTDRCIKIRVDRDEEIAR